LLLSDVIQLTVDGEFWQFDREITVSQLLGTMALVNKSGRWKELYFHRRLQKQFWLNRKKKWNT
jgi:hypothetical protein